MPFQPADSEGMVWKNALSIVFFAAVVLAGVGVIAQSEDHDITKSTSAHKALNCSQCHQVVASIGSTFPGPSPIKQCRTCHSTSSLVQSDLGRIFHSSPERACSDCHSFHHTSAINAAGREFRFSTSSGRALCTACHTGRGDLANLSPGHELAAKLFHSNSEQLTRLTASQACMTCHSENRTVQLDGVSLLSTPQFSDRHTHPLGEVSFSKVGSQGTTIRKNIDPRLHLFGNRIECQTCHDLTSQSKYLLAGFDSPTALCNGCHLTD